MLSKQIVRLPRHEFGQASFAVAGLDEHSIEEISLAVRRVMVGIDCVHTDNRIGLVYRDENDLTNATHQFAGILDHSVALPEVDDSLLLLSRCLPVDKLNSIAAVRAAVIHV